MKIRAGGAFLALAIALASAVSAGTIVVTYHPSQMKITHEVHGNCWTGSIAVPRRDAYRCMVGNNIYDPCFEQSRTRVACPADIRANRGVAIVVASLPPNPVSSPTSIWAMELQTRSLCSVVTGAGVAGFPFGCSGPLMCAAPHKIRSGYIAACAPQSAKGAGHARVYRVIKVWY